MQERRDRVMYKGMGMNLTKVIEKALAQSIMPVLKDGIGLEFNKDNTQIRMVNKKSKKYRSIFDITDKTVKLSNSFAENIMNGFGKNNELNNFVLTKRKFYHKEIKIKLGNVPERFEYYTSYIDENGKEIEFTEMRTRFVPIYNIEHKKELRNFVVFEGDK